MSASAPSRLRPASGGRAARDWSERAARLFEELRVPCVAMVRRAYGGTLGDEEIDDAYANAWAGTLRALEPRQADMDDEEVRRYVFTAVAHQAGKELRRRRRRPVAPLERAELVVDRTASPYERADQQERSRVTRDLLSSLPRRRRAVLLLRYGWGLEPAQVCELIEGLSPRAYRKEITAGVNDLVERIRRHESGDWCADREPVLKAFAAGVADVEQELQAQHHLAHCRPCARFVGKLTGHLHDLGSAAALPGGIEFAADGHADVPDRLIDMAERARESVAAMISRSGAAASDPATGALPAATPRGAAAAGAGAIAKLAGLGAAGKAALVCVGSGAVATVCVVAAVGPLGETATSERSGPRPAEPRMRDVAVSTTLPSQVGPGAGGAEVPASGDPVDGPPGNNDETGDGSTDTETAAQPVPAEVSQFGEPPPPPPPTSTADGDGGGGKASAAEQEFGP